MSTYSGDTICGATKDHSSTSTMNINNVVQPLLTDLYQLTMAYAYWKSNKHNEYAVFDLFFRKNPFKGEFTVFAGLGECLRFVSNFAFSDTDISYIKTLLPATVEPQFYDYLSSVSSKMLKVYAVPEGTVVFSKTPLIRVEGPLAVAQMVETTLLTLVNYASLLATNAARHRIAAGPNIQLLEMGLRRAQGPDGGLSASKYAYIGGFNATSNVLAGKMFGIPVKGTQAHAFIMSYDALDSLKIRTMKHKQSGQTVDFVDICVQFREENCKLLRVLKDEVNDGELAAFAAYAISFPNDYLALIDTYDVLKSGIINFISVALALDQLGYQARGVRIDSGDLAYLSKRIRSIYDQVAQHRSLPWFSQMSIVASNDISEHTIYSLNEQGHKITAFGIGTQLVTCQKQPALGCVYKLVEINQKPCIKLSLDLEKVTIPCRKEVYRLYSEDGCALLDLMQAQDEPAPKQRQRVLCRHPFQENKRAYVTPTKIEYMLREYFADGKIKQQLPDLHQVREYCKQSLNTIRSDIKRYLNPTPYKVSISSDLYIYMHDLWLKNAPIGELY